MLKQRWWEFVCLGIDRDGGGGEESYGRRENDRKATGAYCVFKQLQQRGYSRTLSLFSFCPSFPFLFNDPALSYKNGIRGIFNNDGRREKLPKMMDRWKKETGNGGGGGRWGWVGSRAREGGKENWFESRRETGAQRLYALVRRDGGFCVCGDGNMCVRVGLWIFERYW